MSLQLRIGGSLLACVTALGGCFDPDRAAVSGTDTETETGSESGSGSTAPTTTIDPSTTASTEDTNAEADSSSTTGPESCGGGAGLCLALPEGWFGPVGVATAAAGVEPDCAGLAPTVSVQGDLVAPEPTCGCECMAATGASCTNALLSAWDDDTCGGATLFTQVINPDNGGDPCNFMPGQEVTGDVPLVGTTHWTITTTSVGGSCEPVATVDVPPAAYQTAVTGCATVPLDMPCDDGGTCWEGPPAPLAQGLCVWQTGDHECPPGDFAVRTLYHQGSLADTRGCDACSCGEAAGSCPASEALMYEGYYCNGPGVPISPACTDVCVVDGCDTYAVSSLLYLGEAEASCPPVGGGLVGELVESEPVTFCCTA